MNNKAALSIGSTLFFRQFEFVYVLLKYACFFKILIKFDYLELLFYYQAVVNYSIVISLVMYL